MLAEAQVDYRYDANTDIFLRVAYSTFIDDAQEDWFETIGVESDNTWAGLGVRWSY